MTRPGGAAPVYEASSAKRGRRTKAEMAEFRQAVFEIVARHRPCPARQGYYRTVVAGLVSKDTTGTRKNEAKVGRVLNEMRGAWLQHRRGGPDYWIWQHYAAEAASCDLEART
jgi:hypothetical protein